MNDVKPCDAMNGEISAPKSMLENETEARYCALRLAIDACGNRDSAGRIVDMARLFLSFLSESAREP